jgi:antitoxin (DNA-binding transcriptional repressor) of toxin-antitoxin stability system
MRTVGLKVLKNKLSEYVRLAAGGETVLIADRDRVVAELVPPLPSRAAGVADAVLAGLIRNGTISPAPYPPAAPAGRSPVATLRELLAELASDRSDK